MRKKQKKQITIAIIVLAFAILIFQGNLLSILFTEENPMCVFNEEGNKECLLNVTIPQGAQVKNSVLTLNFDAVPNDEYELPIVVTPINTDTVFSESTYRIETYIENLYRVDNENLEFYDARVNITIGGDGCSGTTIGRIRAGEIDPLYNTDEMIKCTSSDCSGYYRGDEYPTGSRYSYLIKQYKRDDGEWSLSHQNYNEHFSYQFLTCRDGETNYGVPGLYDGTVYIDVPMLNQSVVRFLERLESNTRKDAKGTASLSFHKVEVFKRKAEYPSNVKIFVGDTNVQTFPGTQKNTTISYDIANVINQECGRPYNTEECNINLVLQSDSLGKIEILDEGSFEVVLEPECSPPNMIINGECLNPSDVCTEDGGTKDCEEPPTPITIYIIIGIIVIGGLVLILRKK